MKHLTYSLTSGDLQDLGGETDGAFYAKLLVLGSVNEIGRDFLKQFNVKSR
jgi:hypothetical protein